VGTLGTPEILLIFIVFMLMFGAKKIPDFAQSLGKGIKEFRKAASDIQEGIEKDLK